MIKLIKRIPLSRRVVYRTIFLFGLINGFIFLVNGWSYLYFPPAGLGELAFRYAALFTHFVSLAILLIAILYLLYAVLRVGWIIKTLSVLLFSLAHFFLFVDVRLFKIFRFHISGIALNAMATPGFWDSVHFDPRDKLIAVLIGAGLLLGEFALFTVLFRRLRKGKWLWKATLPRRALVFVGLVIFLVLGEKIVYGISDLYNYTPITRYQKTLPFYQAMTFKRAFKKYGGKEREVKAELDRLAAGAQFNYPLPGFSYGPLPHRYNVIILMVESLRFDMLNDEVMPHLSDFARRSLVGLNHYSAGNASRFGGFGLVYGLYGTYWHPALNHRAGPVLIKQLIRNDYLFKVMSSTSFQFPEFNRTLFVDLETELDDHFPGKNSAERDENLVNSYLEWLKTVPPGQPFFTFIFLDSPHSTYSFPDEFRKFAPCREEVSFADLELGEHREAIFNRYRNAVHYADHSLGRIIKAIKEGGFLENSIVVVTGDHGEEFWENGYYGHNSAYTDYQVKVPLVLWLPGMKQGRMITELTNHIDIPSTILAILGDENDLRFYTLGLNILGPEKAEFLVLSGWDDCCLVTPKLKMRFSTESYNLFGGDIIDHNGRPVQDRALIQAEKDRYLFPAFRGMSRFLK